MPSPLDWNLKSLGKQVMGESEMNSNLYERKSFLEGSLMKTNNKEHFSTEKYNDYTVLKVDLLRATAYEAEAFKKYLRNFHNKDKNKIIIDLSKSSFIDSTFLSTLITFSNKNQYKVKLIVSNRKQLAIFKLTKIDSLFQIFTNLDQAKVS